jgi:hypothetical protein
MVDLSGWSRTPFQLYIGAGAALFLGAYAFTMPACPPTNQTGGRGLISALGLDALALFRHQQMAVFFVFAVLLGAALQITNAFGGAFLDDFKMAYPESFGVKHPNLLLSISQMSETLFVLTIPFVLHRYGIKKVMLISIVAWVFRFGLFAAGDPGARLWMLVLSMIIYGMAFDFFNISGSLFVDRESASRIRAGPVHDHDKWPRRFSRRRGERLGRRSLYGKRHEGLAPHLADVCRIRADPEHRVPAGIPVPAQCGDHSNSLSRDLSPLFADTTNHHYLQFEVTCFL